MPATLAPRVIGCAAPTSSRLYLMSPRAQGYGVDTEKVCVLARILTEDAEGWGECVAGLDPGYSEEWNESAWLVIRDFLAPALFAAGDVTTDDLDRVLGGVRGNPTMVVETSCCYESEHSLSSGHQLAA